MSFEVTSFSYNIEQKVDNKCIHYPSSKSYQWEYTHNDVPEWVTTRIPENELNEEIEHINNIAISHHKTWIPWWLSLAFNVVGIILCALSFTVNHLGLTIAGMLLIIIFIAAFYIYKIYMFRYYHICH